MTLTDKKIVDIIVASLCSPETPIATKIARLYLISDILHNSSSGLSNVWKYRQLYDPPCSWLIVDLRHDSQRCLNISMRYMPPSTGE